MSNHPVAHASYPLRIVSMHKLSNVPSPPMRVRIISSYIHVQYMLKPTFIMAMGTCGHVMCFECAVGLKIRHGRRPPPCPMCQRTSIPIKLLGLDD